MGDPDGFRAIMRHGEPRADTDSTYRCLAYLPAWPSVLGHVPPAAPMPFTAVSSQLPSKFPQPFMRERTRWVGIQ